MSMNYYKGVPAKTNKKFIKRFNYLEDKTLLKGKSLEDLSLEDMEEIWQEAKKYD